MGGGGEQTETMVPSQDAIITLTRPVHPTVQYSPETLAQGTVMPTPRPPPRCQQVVQEGRCCRRSSGTGQGDLAGAAVSPESSRNPGSGHEACWVRGSLAWLLCLICDLWAWLGPAHPEWVAELGLPVGYEGPSVCVGQGGDPACERGAWPASLGFGVPLGSLMWGSSPVTQQACPVPLSQRTESPPPTLSPGGRSSARCRLPLPRRVCSHPLWVAWPGSLGAEGG